MQKVRKFLIYADKADYQHRRQVSLRPQRYVIGIDEVGRGPLAGPVVVAGIKIRRQSADFLFGIKDSKKLIPKKREEWYDFLIHNQKIEFAVARIWPKTIDRINITQAANRGAYMVYKKLAGGFNTHALLDGGLYLPKCIPSKTIIKGDEKIPVISAASIIAKVTRDRIMLRLHKKFPQYRFDANKGYATRLHRELLKTYSISAVHRLSFCKKLSQW